MTMAAQPSSSDKPVKLNHFHEYDTNDMELFEIREITPPPSPEPVAESSELLPPTTRVGKLRNALKRVTGKKKGKQPAEVLPATVTIQGTGWQRTVPRMKKAEREAQMKDGHDEAFGLGKYYQPPAPKPFDPENIIPFEPTLPRRARTVRWDSSSARARMAAGIPCDEEEKVHQRAKSTDDIIDVKEARKRRDMNPYWEEEFELPEPELRYEAPSYAPPPAPTSATDKPLPPEPTTVPVETHPAERAAEFPDLDATLFDDSGYIPIDLTDIYVNTSVDDREPLLRKSASHDLMKTITPNLDDIPTPPMTPSFLRGCSCGSASCDAACIHILTSAGIAEALGGVDNANMIMEDMIRRLGPPIPFPTLGVNQTPTKTLFTLRKRRVIQTYARYGATYIFQKLIVAIRSSLDKFQPSHQGILSFEFEVIFFIGFSDQSRTILFSII
jgi:hypothetical protein